MNLVNLDFSPDALSVVWWICGKLLKFVNHRDLSGGLAKSLPNWYENQTFKNREYQP